MRIAGAVFGIARHLVQRSSQTIIRVLLGVAVTVATSAVPSSAVAADMCRQVSGYVMTYYFNASDKLIGMESLLTSFPQPGRSKAKTSNKDIAKLFADNLAAAPDFSDTTTELDVKDLAAETALYVLFEYGNATPGQILCAEDLKEMNSGDWKVKKAKKEQGGGVCGCALVWCGRYKCCPC